MFLGSFEIGGIKRNSISSWFYQPASADYAIVLVLERITVRIYA